MLRKRSSIVFIFLIRIDGQGSGMVQPSYSPILRRRATIHRLDSRIGDSFTMPPKMRQRLTMFWFWSHPGWPRERFRWLDFAYGSQYVGPFRACVEEISGEHNHRGYGTSLLVPLLVALAHKLVLIVVGL